MERNKRSKKIERKSLRYLIFITMLHFLSAVSKTGKVIFRFDRMPSHGFNPHHDFLFLQLVDSSERPLVFSNQSAKANNKRVERSTT